MTLVGLFASGVTALAEPPPNVDPQAAAALPPPTGLWEELDLDDETRPWGGEAWGTEKWQPEEWDLTQDLELGAHLVQPPSRLRARPISADLLDQVTLVRRLPGTQSIRYRGLQGFVVRRLRRVYQSRWRRSMRDAERAGGLDHFELAARYQAMAEAESDLAAGGRWWERSWLHSLSEARGGAPKRHHETQIGGQVEVFRLGPLSLTNDFRARVSGLGFRLTPTPGRVFRDLGEDELARDHARLAREFGADDGEREDLDELPSRPRSLAAEERERGEGYAPDEHLPIASMFDLNLEASVPQPDLAYKFHFRPEARVRLRAGSQPKARVGLRAVLEISMGPSRARKHVVDVVARVRYDVTRRNLLATVQLQLVAW